MRKLDLELIHKKLNGTISTHENDELNAWLEASDVHREYFERVRYYKQKRIEELDLDLIPNTSKDFMRRLKSRNRTLRLKQMMKYAAVILFPLLAGVALWQYSTWQADQYIVKKTLNDDFVKEHEQAILITSSGKTYELETGAEESIVEEDGVKIRKYMKAGLKYEQKVKTKERKLAYNTLKTSKGGEYLLELADGTIVHLNCDSELRYPVSFGEEVRKVELKGEAYFEVTKNGKPFFVEVGGMAVEVLGTKFNVMAYDDEETIQTTLVSGKVKVIASKNGEQQDICLQPGKQANWHKNTGELISRKVNTDLYTSWIDGYFRFENQRLEDIMRNVSRWYDIKVFYQNQKLKDMRLTGKLYRFEDFNVIANMVFKISGIRMSKNKNVVVIMNKE
jgi:ferric-dicitrate binding protein FerR (iron transport regulator)